MKTIGLVPMAAKPYHAGHDGLVRIAARETDEVHLFVSTSDRKRPGEMPIYGADMKRIWDEFLEPSLPSNVVVTYGGSPVSHLYDDLVRGEQEGTEDVFVIYSDSEDIKKYTDAVLSKAAPTLMYNGQIERRGVDRSETVNVSGTKMRALLNAGNVEDFAAFLPPAVQAHSQEIIDILTGKARTRKIESRSNKVRHLIKEYVKELLSEDIVTISKGTESSVYDVLFDKAGDIKKGTKVDIDEQSEELLKKAMRLTSAPIGAVLEKLTSGIPIQQTAKDPTAMAKILTKNWKDTLSWPVPSRIGRGELSMTLAFKRSETIAEPDFVSEDGNIKLSAKFVGDGRDVAMTGGADQRVADTIQKLGQLLKIKFPQAGTWSATHLRRVLDEMDPATRTRTIPKIRKILNEIKSVILYEHDALGIMLLDTARGFYFIDDPGQIQPSAIRFSGTRVEFKGPYGSGATLESALDY